MPRRALVVAAFLTACSSEAGRPPADVARPGGVVAPTPTPRAVRAPEHAVFSLYDNRPLAHVQRGGGLLLLPGSGGFARYVNFGRPKLAWKLRQRSGARAVGMFSKSTGVMELPLTAAQATAGGAVSVRLWAPDAGKLGGKLNDKELTTAAVAQGWQTVALDIPAGAALAGENRLELYSRIRGELSVEWIQIGGATGAGDPPMLSDGRDLLLAEGNGLAWYVLVPPGGRLTADVIGEGCEVVVTTAGQDGDAATGSLLGTGAAVDLAARAGQVVRLELTARGCPEARVREPALSIPGEAPRVQRGKPPRYVVFWVMDTLRADRIPTITPGARAEVPTFDRLAAGGAVFLHAYSAGNESQQSHASMFTGAYPVNHGIIPVAGYGWKFPKAWTPLGTMMKAAGFYTVGITGNGFVTAPGGYGRGFDVYKNLMRGADSIQKNNTVLGEALLAVGLAELKGREREPFLLWLGTIDTHFPLVGHEPWLTRYDPEPYQGKFAKKATARDIGVSFVVSRKKPSARDFERIKAIYDSDVSYQDQLVGDLIEQLEAWGIADETMIVITSDHGEEWWEDGRGGHGGSVREVLVHVPLIIHYPPLFPPGAQVSEGVENLDVLATILDAVGVAPPAENQGESLIPLAHGVGRGYPRPQVATQYEYAHAMRLDRWKLRVAASGAAVLYDIVGEPIPEEAEFTDLSAARPYERRFVADAMGLWMVYRAEWKKAAWGVASNLTAAGGDALE